MTNHNGLRYLFDKPKLNAMNDRQMDLLSKFYFEIKPIKGKEKRVDDYLTSSMKVVHFEDVSTYKSYIKERVKSAQEKYEFFIIVKACLEKEPTTLKYDGYKFMNDGLLTYKGRLYILSCDDLKRFIMDELHKIPYTGHPNYQKNITTTKKLFYWPRMKKEIYDYLAKFLEC
jgi:hypothetical protein